MEINRKNILDVVNNSNAKPDKDYGQNFLVEPEDCKKIVDALNIDKSDKVLEIGPGLGSLSHFLTPLSDDVSLVDIDERMIAFLKLFYGNLPNVKVIQQDIRKHDVGGYDKIIGNLPYNITSETIVYLLINATKVKKIVLMIQSDAFPHFYDVEGKEYGPASVLLHLLGESKRLFQVKPGSFYPAPKCSSVVFEVNIDPKCSLEEAKETYKFAKSLFLNRRKTILNNLNNVTKDKEVALSLLKACDIENTSRPEDISPLNYLKLYRAYQLALSK